MYLQQTGNWSNHSLLTLYFVYVLNTETVWDLRGWEKVKLKLVVEGRIRAKWKQYTEGKATEG